MNIKNILNLILQKLKNCKVKRNFIIGSIVIIIILFFIVFKKNTYNDDVFWYLTDNNTVLHLSGVKPNDSNYKIGQNNYMKYKSKFIKNLGRSIGKGRDGSIEFYKKKLFSKFSDTKHPFKSVDVLKSPIFYVNRIVIENEIRLKNYIDFEFMENLSQIENMHYLKTSNLTSMSSMFNGCKSLTELDLSNFDTSNVTSMMQMFAGCESLTSLDLFNFNTSNVTNMDYMFLECESLVDLNLSNFDTSNVTSMAQMFQKCKSFNSLDLSNFDTSNVRRFPMMFEGCTSLINLNISEFDNSSVEYDDMNSMFGSCGQLKTIYCNNDFIIKNYDTDLFLDCKSLVGGCGTRYDEQNIDIKYAKVDTKYQSGYFTRNDDVYRNTNFKKIKGLPRHESEYRDDGYFYLNNCMQKSTWVYYVTYYYHVDGVGNIEKNKWVDKRYVGADGKMYQGRQTPDGKWVGDDGYVVEDLAKDLNDSTLVKSVEPDSWYKTQSGLWYYFENDRTTTKKGWFNDDRDDQTYYFDPDTGIMATGWTVIDGDEYYFNEYHGEVDNWYETGDGFYESLGKKVKAYGSMYKNETTPDGKFVNEDGKVIE